MWLAWYSEKTGVLCLYVKWYCNAAQLFYQKNTTIHAHHAKIGIVTVVHHCSKLHRCIACYNVSQCSWVNDFYIIELKQNALCKLNSHFNLCWTSWKTFKNIMNSTGTSFTVYSISKYYEVLELYYTNYYVQIKPDSSDFETFVPL